MTKILVTGASGFVGNKVFETLSKNHQVYGITKTLFGSHTDQIFICDLTNRTTLSQMKELKDIEILIHLSSLVPKKFEPEGDFDSLLENNLIATKNILDFLPNLHHICLSSTIEVYGNQVSSPIEETHSYNPITPYGFTKLLQEEYVKYYSNRKNLTYTILRFASIYGPNEPFFRVIPNFIKSSMSKGIIEISGDGKEMRDFIFLDDAVKCIEIAIEKKIPGIFNVTSGKPISIKDLAFQIAKIFGKEIKIIHISTNRTPKDMYLSTKKAEREFDLKSFVPLHNGLKEEIDFLRQNLD